MRIGQVAAGLALASLGLGLALFACSSDDSSAGSGVDDQNLGTCQTGYPTDGGKFPLSALPSGTACTGATSCTLPVDTCAADLASANGGVNLSEYECDCLDGGWSCYAAVVVDDSCDGGPIVVASEDAGTDAPVADGASAEASVDGGDSGVDGAVEASAGDASEDAPASDDGGHDASDASDAAGD
jgi:hypothetical protein